MIPRIAISLTFRGYYDDDLELTIPETAFGGSLRKVKSDLSYESIFLEEYHLGDLLERFILFYNSSIRSLPNLLSKTTMIFLNCHVYASDTIPSINLTDNLMKSILNLHENISLDIDIILTEE